MSDTDVKIAKRREEAQKAKARNARRANSAIPYAAKKKIVKGVAIALVAILALVIILPNIGLTKRAVTAMKVGDNKISSAEFSYYYTEQLNDLYYTYYSYGLTDYFPIDLNTALRKQTYSGDISYADYFESQAIESIKQMYVLYSEAKANGVELTEEEKENIQESLKNIDITAASYGYSTNRYLRRSYGPGFNRDLLEKIYTVQTLASSYSNSVGDSYSYELTDLAAYYDTHKNDLDKLSIRYYKVAANYAANATEDEKQAVLESCRLQADTLINGVTTEEEYSANVLNYMKSLSADPDSVTTESSLHTDITYNTLKSTSTALADWAVKAGRAAGDTAVIDAGDSTGYYAVYMVQPSYRDSYSTVDVRHILFQFDSSADATAKAALKTKAADLLNQWKSNPSEESFAAMADEYSDDSAEGGLYTKVYKNQMTSAFNNWIFDETRKPGDTGIVETEYGYHIMYYVGENVPYWQISAENALRNEDYAKYYQEAAEKYEVTTNAFGLWYRNEPIK